MSQEVMGNEVGDENVTSRSEDILGEETRIHAPLFTAKTSEVKKAIAINWNNNPIMQGIGNPHELPDATPESRRKIQTPVVEDKRTSIIEVLSSVLRKITK